MRIFLVILISCCFAVICLSPVNAETIFIKTGHIIDGRIVSDGNKSIVVQRTDTKKNETILHSDIIRIAYTEMYLGKVYIRLASGEVKPGYIVDEDAKQYTVRNDINKPDEYTLPRSKVIFIARSNPTDLTGEYSNASIEIRWAEPYVPGKVYRVYIREKSAPAFTFVAEAKKTAMTIRDLRGKPNTVFM